MLSGDEGMFIIHLLGMTHFPKALNRWQVNLGIHAIFSSTRFWTVRYFIFLMMQKRDMHFCPYFEVWEIAMNKILSR